ncbi:MAG: hypothetical protein K2N11_05160 [Mucispirillum sp.]|nr:hypothetical protein [Mucispirillum sp.]
MKKNLLLIFVLSLMAIFAGCADEKGEPNIVYGKDDNTGNNTDNNTGMLPENITYSIIVNSISRMDKADNTSEWRFLPNIDSSYLEAVFADILGRPDNESNKIMCIALHNCHLEGDRTSVGGYWDDTNLGMHLIEYDYVNKECWYSYQDYSDGVYSIEIENNLSPYIRDYKILFNYVKEQILNNPYKNRYKELDTITVKTSE